MSDGGKGSKPRPIEIPREKFEQNWNAIFGKKVKNHMQRIHDDRTNLCRHSLQDGLI